MFLPAGGHFASLKLTQRDETLSFPSLSLLNRGTGAPQVASKCASRLEHADHGARVSDRETITKAASMRVRSHASDAECPEALPVYSVLHVLAIQLVDECK